VSLDVKIRDKPRDPPSLAEEEIEKLYNAIDEPKYQYFISVLYSTGARAEEFHNIRFSDIALPDKEKGEEYVKVTLRKEYSKTKGRTISLYWKYALPAVKRYLNQRIKEGIKPNEPVFPLKYASMRDWLKRLSNRVLQKDVNFHLLRHSLATHLATKMNRQQLCVYFGWAFSSCMPDVYIDRSGIELKEIDEKFNKTKNEELETEIERLKLSQEEIMEKNNEITEMLTKVLSDGKLILEKK
jgi:integrase